MKNVIKPLAKSLLIPLGLTSAASVADSGIHKQVLGLGRHLHTTTLIISNDEYSESLEDSGLSLKRVSEMIQNKDKKQKGEFLSMLLGALDISLLGNILAGKGAIAKREGGGINRAAERIVRAGHGKKMDF